MSAIKRAVLQIERLQKRVVDLEARQSEPIAVVGIGCRFPGGAEDPESLWRLLRKGGDAITEVPADRWDVEQYYDPDPDVPGKISTRRGGFLTQRVDGFDPGLFGIAPREAESMDPQQRLLLEVAWEALEHAGRAPDEMIGSATGVFVGTSTQDYCDLLERGGGLEDIDAYFASGTGQSVFAGRLSYVLGLQGPSLAIDCACSSSLVTVHFACRSLRSGECDLALAGGVNLMLSPSLYIAYTKSKMLAADGRCKTFDAAADGFGRAEGCGLVVLKRLRDAVADGDRVLAVIRGSAVNQDGASSGLTAPNGPAQEAVLRAALADARLEPADVGFVETHGTGTVLGDPIEVQALGAVLGAGRPAGEPLILGSIKTNLGHLESAAGVAGLIKVVLALQHREIPPHLHLEKPNPFIPWDDLPVRVATERTPWEPPSGRRIAGVSSFGFSGTNAHILLEEAPRQEEPVQEEGQAAEERPLHLLTLAAASEPALVEQARQWNERLAAAPDLAPADVAFTANTGRARLVHRSAVMGASTAELASALDALARGEEAPGVWQGRCNGAAALRPVFLFSGQGAQRVGMGRGLYEAEPVFRAVLDRCDARLRERRGESLLAVLYPSAGQASPIDHTAWTQPALFAVEMALAELWRSWGIEPAAVMGHSIGEIAAACVAGVMDLEVGLDLVSRRGELMGSLPEGGAMAVVFADEETVLAALKDTPEVSIAAVNGSCNLTVSGADAVLSPLLERWRAEGVDAKRLKVSHAFHSALLDPILDSLEEAVGEGLRSPRIPWICNLTGRPADVEKVKSGRYWREQARRPVRFADGIETLLARGFHAFVEIGPEPTCLTMARRIAPPDFGLWVPSLRRQREDAHQILEALATLWTQGAAVDWRGFDRGRARRPLAMPTYPFQRRRYWKSTAFMPSPGTQKAEAPGSADEVRLLGRQLRSPRLREVVFERSLSSRSPAFLDDHRYHDLVIFPAAGYLAMALEAARRQWPGEPVELAGVSFIASLAFTSTDQRTVQLVWAPDRSGSAHFEIYSLDERAGEGGWILHCEGDARALTDGAGREDLDALRAKCRTPQSLEGFYADMEAAGVQLGDHFQPFREMFRGTDEMLGLLRKGWRRPESCEVIDGALQLFAAGLMGEDTLSAHVPIAIARFRWWPQSTSPTSDSVRWGHCLLEPAASVEQASGVSRLLSDSGEPVLELSGIRVKGLDREMLSRAFGASRDDWFLRLSWVPIDAAVSAAPRSSRTERERWLLLADAAGFGQELAAVLEARGAAVELLRSGNQSTNGAGSVIDPLDPEAFSLFLSDHPEGEEWTGVVFFGGLDGTEPREQASRLAAGLHLVQAASRLQSKVAPPIWWVTRGAQAVGSPRQIVAPAQATLWGMMRSVALEHPDLRCRRVDLDPVVGTVESTEQLLAELNAGDSEDQVAYRDGVRFAARLVSGSEGASLESLTLPAGDRYRLKASPGGELDRMILEPFSRRAPAAGEVEIRITASGLNFRDVLSALRTLGDADLPYPGSECAGTVVAVGEGVDDLEPGDEVVAFLAPESLASHITLARSKVVGRPEALSVIEAAGAPSIFLTADLALGHLAKLQEGERVLIHAAAGGVGMAAVEIARSAGAEIFVTASPGKWPLLRSMGLRHIFSSRDLDFVQGVFEATGGAGVDVVLNSLAGEFVAASLETLAPSGRFVEIGKREVWRPEQMAAARPDVAYFHFDLGDPVSTGGLDLREALGRLLERLASGELEAPPRRVFSLTEAPAAFRWMARARHVGKIVITPGSAEPKAGEIREDRTYLVTGGLGALGRHLARRLVQRGARNLLLLGRRPPGEEALADLETLRNEGARVEVRPVDVADLEALRATFASAREEMPLLGGVFHAAGALDDGMVRQQSWERFEKVLAPKVQGAWNLHLLAGGLPLDHFVLFSSISAVVGSAGQSSYAAANAFLDALAQHRRAQGLPALAVGWGPWEDGGMATATSERLRRRWREQGLGTMAPERALDALEAAWSSDRAGEAHQIVAPLDLERLLRSFPAGRAPALYSGFAAPAKPSGSPEAEPFEASLRLLLEEVPAGECRAVLEEEVAKTIARVLGLGPDQMPDREQPFPELGLDSLMAVELKNMLAASIGETLPTTLLFDYATLGTLTDYLFDEVLGLSTDEESTASLEESTASTDLLAKVSELSDEELEALINEELARTSG